MGGVGKFETLLQSCVCNIKPIYWEDFQHIRREEEVGYFQASVPGENGRGLQTVDKGTLNISHFTLAKQMTNSWLVLYSATEVFFLQGLRLSPSIVAECSTRVSAYSAEGLLVGLISAVHMSWRREVAGCRGTSCDLANMWGLYRASTTCFRGQKSKPGRLWAQLAFSRGTRSLERFRVCAFSETFGHRMPAQK